MKSSTLIDFGQLLSVSLLVILSILLLEIGSVRCAAAAGVIGETNTWVVIVEPEPQISNASRLESEISPSTGNNTDRKVITGSAFPLIKQEFNSCGNTDCRFDPQLLCTSEPEYVCGNNGITYQNECWLTCDQRCYEFPRPPLYVLHPGPC